MTDSVIALGIVDCRDGDPGPLTLENLGVEINARPLGSTRDGGRTILHIALPNEAGRDHRSISQAIHGLKLLGRGLGAEDAVDGFIEHLAAVLFLAGYNYHDQNPPTPNPASSS